MLQWENDSKKVLIAAEEGMGPVILNRLREMTPYDDEGKWTFELADNSSQLILHSGIDVILLSRFLLGNNPMGTLDVVQSQFPNAHTVLLVGPKNAQSHQYIQQAKNRGYNNIVTGNLPGELPYTLDLALRYTLDEVLRGIKQPKEIKPERGYLVAVAGSKGGVGKTTVTAGITLALAANGIITTTADSDFSRQDLTAFFKTFPVSYGFDQIADEPMSVNEIKKLIIPVKKIQGINIFPGSGVKIPLRWPQEEEVRTAMQALRETSPVVVVDTPSDLNCSHTPALLQEADLVFVVIDQSRFSEQDIYDYGDYLIAQGVQVKKLRLVANKYSSKLFPIPKLQEAFIKGVQGDVPVVANIPHNWEKYARMAYDSQVVGTNDRKGPWQALAREIGREANLTIKNNSGGLLSFFRQRIA